MSPNYDQLVRYLVEPLLDNPESLSLNCELSRGNQKVLIRLAFDPEEQGKVFGRGGRNIEAIRMVLEAAASAVGQSARLEIYGSQNAHSSSSETSGPKRERNNRPPRSPRRSSPVSKPSPRRRSET
ncbi:KH domain-containing protein [Spirulina subsalsa FACHB-351]|uniref:KH domain-containing protein n=1 Tax=Spirulina subsalsa FACHB-351 TaxID=234711 RepID=A0ABT3L3R2_9CYAN|nr:KH domain-containing protein [Spirulina subsalsa]MCW6036138.1 KH domain-containing protein [Spirulina subsalsa FACHB-351]